MNPKDPFLLPDLLQDCLNLTKDTFSTLNEINKKRKKMNIDKEIPNEMIDRFLETKPRAATHGLLKDWEIWKSSYSVSSSEKVDWRILIMRSEAQKNILFHRQSNGTFVSPEWPFEDFDLEKDLLNNKNGKKYEIFTVQRESDLEAFCIGDRIGWGEIGNYETTLLSFRINASRENRLEFEYQVTDKTRSFCDFSDAIRLHKKNPKPLPIFTTEDGKEVFPEDTFSVWKVDPDFQILTFAACDCSPKARQTSKYFSTREAANSWILWNKPCLSVAEVISASVLIPITMNMDYPKSISYFFTIPELTKLASSKIQGGKE